MRGETILYVSYAALWVLVAFQTLVLLELVRQSSAASRSAASEASPSNDSPASEMLPTGHAAPAFEAPEVETGRIVRSIDLLEHRTILVFMSPTCASCDLVVDELTGFRNRMRSNLVVICRGTDSECAEWVRSQLPGSLALLDETNAIAEKFHISRTPAAVLLDRDGTLLRYGFPRSQIRLGLDNLVELLQDEPNETADGAAARPFESARGASPAS